MPDFYQLLAFPADWCRWIILLFVTLGTAVPCLAQYKVIEVDSISMQPSQQLPFDEPFMLRIPIKAQDVSAVYCFELFRHRTLQETLAQRFIQSSHLTFPSFRKYSALEESGFEVKTVGKVRYLLLYANARGATDARVAEGIDRIKYSSAVGRDTTARNTATLAADALATMRAQPTATASQLESAARVAAEANKQAVQAAKAVRQNRLLNPGREYTFLWATTTVSDEAWVALDQYRLYQVAKKLPPNQPNRDSLIAAAKQNLSKAYLALFDGMRKRAGLALTLPTPVKAIQSDFKDPFEGVPRLYKEAEYTKLDSVEQLIIATPPSPPSSIAREAYNRLTTYIMAENTHFDSHLKSAYLSDPKKATQRIQALNQSTYDKAAAIIAGFQPLDCNGCKPLASFSEKRDYTTRTANLKSSLASVEELRIVAQQLAITDTLISPAVRHLQAYSKALQKASAQLIIATAQRKKIQKAFLNVHLNDFQNLGASTSSLTFETRTKLSIGPDFGVVTTWPFSGTTNPYFFVPYLGFHVNFRPYNRDIPYVLYPHKPLHRLSAVVGWSLVNVDYGPKQAARAEQDSIASFFKNKGTLLTGFGFRLSSAIQLTAGSMWYFRYQKEQSAPMAPVQYVARHISAWPYVGITIDLSLKDILNDITSILPAAPRAYTPPVSATPAAN